MGTLAITIFPGGRPSAPYRHAESHQLTRCIQAQRSRCSQADPVLESWRTTDDLGNSQCAEEPPVARVARPEHGRPNWLPGAASSGPQDTFRGAIPGLSPWPEGVRP